MDGWGIGYFKKSRAYVEKSAEGVYVAGQVHDSFQRLARVINSRIILCHVRLRTSGPIDECHAHPFILHFGGHDWLFIHNGRAPAVENYHSRGTPIDGAVSDSSKAFEYLRDQLDSHFQIEPSPETPSLFETLYRGTGRLIDEHPGNYNYLLTNGRVLFAFTNHRQFMLLRGSNELAGTLLLTTLQRGLSDDNWRRVAKSTSRQGLLLMISGPDIILQQAL
jgi:glutamine amidotransferase